MKRCAVAWFRRDLRLHDNPAWAAAVAHRKICPVVVLEPGLLAAAGPHRRCAYLAAVAGLEQSLEAVGATLTVIVGDPTTAVPALAADIGADTVTVNADVSPYAKQRDRRTADRLDGRLDTHWGSLVHRPGSVLTRRGSLSQVFTPFWRTWQAAPLPPAAADDPGTAVMVEAISTLSEARARLCGLGIDIDAQAQTDCAAGDESGDESGASSGAAWSEHDAAAQLAFWNEQVDDYENSRNLFAVQGTSGLSAALHFGLLSPRSAVAATGTCTPGRAAFVRQIAWRDWYAHLAYEHADIGRSALNKRYERIAWADGAEADRSFAAWKEGRTGYPIVDAAMRELTATGWMHNRLRMVTASFLVKGLLIDWRRGERWFRRMLTDGDFAQNAGNWQWVAGTGPDAAPYFRILNPVTQSRRFDAEGGYLRRWLPELADLDSDAVHAPWEASSAQLAAAGIRLGVEYPAPVIDHAASRQRTLAAYQAARDSEERAAPDA